MGSGSGTDPDPASGAGVASVAVVPSGRRGRACPGDRCEQRAAGRARQSSVRHRRPALGAVDGLLRHRDTSPFGAASGRTVSQRRRRPFRAPVTRSAVRGPPERPIGASRRWSKWRRARRRPRAMSSRPTTHRKTNATTDSTARTGSSSVAQDRRRGRPGRARADPGRQHDQHQDDRRDPESGQCRERVPKARPDRPDERPADAVPGQHDPPCRDGPDDLADHPGDHDRGDHLGRLAQDAHDDRCGHVRRTGQLAIGHDDQPDRPPRQDEQERHDGDQPDGEDPGRGPTPPAGTVRSPDPGSSVAVMSSSDATIRAPSASSAAASQPPTNSQASSPTTATTPAPR